MTKRDWFGLAIRIIGVWYVTQGLYFIFLSIAKHSGLDPNSPYPAEMDRAVAAFYVVLGIGLAVCAEAIVWLVYRVPQEPVPPDADTNAE